MLCFSHQFTSYTTNLITSLFPTLALLYPTLQITDVWETPSNYPTKETITEVLAKTHVYLQSVKSFNPYDSSCIQPTPTPGFDLPPQPKNKIQKHLGHNNPPPRSTASISPQLSSSWTQPPPPTPNPRQNYTRVHPHISWGNPHTPPSPIRVVFQNCNTLNRDHFTRFSYLNKLMTLQPHIVGLAETNLNWSHFPTKTSVYSYLKA